MLDLTSCYVGLKKCALSIEREFKHVDCKQHSGVMMLIVERKDHAGWRLGHISFDSFGQCDYNIVNMDDDSGFSDNMFIVNEVGLPVTSEDWQECLDEFISMMRVS